MPPSVTILVPTLNEERYVRRAITSVLPSDGALDYELIVLDGGSTDRTRDVIAEMAASNERIRLADNKARIQAAAINLGASMAKSESSVIVRADCHSEYPPRFVERVTRELRERGCASVVVPQRSAGTSFVQRGIAAAQNSRLINGGLAHRVASVSRYVEHGHHAAFDRRAFDMVGGYDEGFACNEDAEFDMRLAKAGAKIWLCSDLGITYFPRASFAALAKQYFSYGAGRAMTSHKHGRSPKIRQLLPVVALTANVSSLIAGIVFSWQLLLLLFAYCATCSIWGGVQASSRGDPACWTSGIAAMIMHHCWAAGFICKTVGLNVPRRAKTKAASRLRPS